MKRRRASPKKLSAPSRDAARSIALGRMMAGFIHQFRTPLYVINSSIEELQRSRFLLPKTKAHLGLIQRSAGRLQENVMALLAYAKGEPVPWTEGSLNAVVESLMDYLSEECRKKRIRLEKQLSPRLSSVRMQSKNLEEALMNLIVNALQAMPKDGTLKIASDMTPEGKSVQLQISDQGTGMTKRTLVSTGRGFRTTKKDGMGFGLFFSAQILRQHRATIHIASEKSKGTTVTIKFPTHP